MKTRKLSRRELLKSVAFFGGGAMLAACAPQATPPPAAVNTQPVLPTQAAPTQPALTQAPAATDTPVPTPPPQEALTMEIWMWSDQNRPHFQEQVDRWNQTQTGKPKLTLNYVLTTDSETTVQKGMNAMAAGSGIPDVFPIEITQMSKFFKGDPALAEANLMDLVPSLDVFDKDWKNNYIGFSPYTWKGKIYGFEIGISPTGYYYRSDIFDQLGVKMPLETWEDFMAAGETLAKAGHSMFAFDTTGAGMLAMIFNQSGALMFDNEGKVAFDEPRVYTALKLVVDACKNKTIYSTDGYWNPPHFAALNDGSIAGVMSANWYSEFVLKPNCKDTSGKWHVQAMPKWKTTGPWSGDNFNERPTSTEGGTAMSIPKKGPKPDLTFEYMAFSMLTKEGGISVYKHIQQVPMVKSVIHDESIINVADPFYGGQAFNKLFADIAESIPPINIGAYYNEANQELTNILVPAIDGDDTPDKLVSSAAKKVEDLISVGG